MENKASPASQKSRLDFHINGISIKSQGKITDKQSLKQTIVLAIKSAEILKRGSRGGGEKMKPVTEITRILSGIQVKSMETATYLKCSAAGEGETITTCGGKIRGVESKSTGAEFSVCRLTSK